MRTFEEYQFKIKHSNISNSSHITTLKEFRDAISNDSYDIHSIMIVCVKDGYTFYDSCINTNDIGYEDSYMCKSIEEFVDKYGTELEYALTKEDILSNALYKKDETFSIVEFAGLDRNAHNIISTNYKIESFDTYFLDGRHFLIINLI